MGFWSGLGTNKQIVLKPIYEITLEKCDEGEKDQTREDLGEYQSQGEDEEPTIRSEVQLERQGNQRH